MRICADILNRIVNAVVLSVYRVASQMVEVHAYSRVVPQISPYPQWVSPPNTRLVLAATSASSSLSGNGDPFNHEPTHTWGGA